MSKYIVKLICCGRDDGTYEADTWEEADKFRESYTSGEAVAKHGYSDSEHNGHKRVGIITAQSKDVAKQPIHIDRGAGFTHTANYCNCMNKDAKEDTL